MNPLTEQMIEAALIHVAFDGWSEATFRAAIEDTGTTPAVARATFPRGAVDLAVAFHHIGDARLRSRLQDADLSNMRFRDRVAHAVRTRLELVEQDKEAVRRGTTLFALPMYAGDGTKLIWGTADTIWTALGDTSQDYNWYTKRATLSGVYASTVLFWLGDDSLDHQDTWAFLDRRIDNVMQFEKVKAQVSKNPVLSKVFAGPLWALSKVKAPAPTFRQDLPGRWTEPPAS